MFSLINSLVLILGMFMLVPTNNEDCFVTYTACASVAQFRYSEELLAAYEKGGPQLDRAIIQANDNYITSVRSCATNYFTCRGQ